MRIGINKVEAEESRVEIEKEAENHENRAGAPADYQLSLSAINAPLVLQKSQLYYRFGGKQMAVKLSNSGGMTTTWMHGDHLGSASFATYANGTKVANSDTRYTPFGGYRVGYEGLGLPTDKRFTGHQAEDASLTGGLVFAQARFYLPGLGRFISADTIVPGAGNPQAFNRYAYVLGNPMKFTDPSGHDPKDDNGNSTNTCAYGYGCSTFEMGIARSYQSRTGTHYSPNSSAAHQTQAQAQLDELRENDRSILLVPAVACAIAAPCLILVAKFGSISAGTGATAEIMYQGRSRMKVSNNDLNWTIESMDWNGVGIAGIGNAGQGIAGKRVSEEKLVKNISAQVAGGTMAGYTSSCISTECPDISTTLIGGFLSPTLARATGNYLPLPNPVVDMAANLMTRSLTTSHSEAIQLRERYLQSRYSDTYFHNGAR